MNLEEYLISIGKKPKRDNPFDEKKGTSFNPNNSFSCNNKPATLTIENSAGICNNKINEQPIQISDSSDTFESYMIPIMRETPTYLPTFAERDMLQYCIKLNIPYKFIN